MAKDNYFFRMGSLKIWSHFENARPLVKLGVWIVLIQKGIIEVERVKGIEPSFRYQTNKMAFYWGF